MRGKPFERGCIPWNKGRKGLDYLKHYKNFQTISPFKKGKRISQKTEFKKGNKPQVPFLKGLIPWNKGRKGLQGSNNGSFKKGDTGSKAKGWKGGLTSINKIIRNSFKYKEWRNSVFNRDDYTCQNCGKRGCKLNVHHIFGFAYFKNLRFNLNNGITLCEKCHLETRLTVIKN